MSKNRTISTPIDLPCQSSDCTITQQEVCRCASPLICYSKVRAAIYNMPMRIQDFDYTLPPELIAQTPVEPRDTSRLLVLHRDSGRIQHRHFYELGEYL